MKNHPPTVQNSIVYLDDDIGIETLRIKNNTFYSVHPVQMHNGTKSYAFIMYAKQGEGIFALDSWLVDKIPDKNDFLKLQKRKIATFGDVQAIDHSTYFCYVSENTGKSYHRFKDGTIAEIDYEASLGGYLITNITIDKDPHHFYDTLLKKGYCTNSKIIRIIKIYIILYNI